MAKRIRQFRYGTRDDNITGAQLVNGLRVPICQLSIEALPGTKFVMANEVIVIGITGVYEVAIETIDTLFLDSKAYAIMQENIERGDSRYKIIINIVYDE